MFVCHDERWHIRNPDQVVEGIMHVYLYVMHVYLMLSYYYL